GDRAGERLPRRRRRRTRRRGAGPGLRRRLSGGPLLTLPRDRGLHGFLLASAALGRVHVLVGLREQRLGAGVLGGPGDAEAGVPGDGGVAVDDAPGRDCTQTPRDVVDGGLAADVRAYDDELVTAEPPDMVGLAQH